MNYLTDEQAILKANGLDWTNSKLDTKPNSRFDFDQATAEDILVLYNNQVSRLKNLKAIEEDLGVFDEEKFKRMSKFVMLVRSKLIEKEGGRELLDQLNREKKIGYLVQSKDNEILKLKGKIETLNVELNKTKDMNSDKLNFQKSEVERLGIQIKILNEKQRLKIANIESSNKRNHLIHNKFKELIKNHIGMSAYLEIIQEADRLTDLELSNNQDK